MDFLSKKSWHPKRLQNVEKVWKAEQEAAAEQKKLKELQRKLQEERQIEELRRLQYASGNSSKPRQQRLEWMYEGDIAAKQTTSEEYLQGKKFEEKDEDAEAVKNKSLGKFQNKELSVEQDTWSKLREDPLLAIQQQEQKKLEFIKQNPVQMAQIKAQLYLMEKQRKDAKKEKKRKKREKKEKKKKKKEKRAMNGEDDSEDRKEHRKRAKHHHHSSDDEVKRETENGHGNVVKTEKGDEERKRRYSSNGRHRDYEKNGEVSVKRERESRDRDRDRDRHRSSDRKRRSSEKDSTRHRDREYNHDVDKQIKQEKDDEEEAPTSPKNGKQQSEGICYGGIGKSKAKEGIRKYGLVYPKGKEPPPSSSSDGNSKKDEPADFLEIRRRMAIEKDLERQKQEEEVARKRRERIAREKALRGLNAEEKRKRLEQMQKAAEENERARAERLKQHKKELEEKETHYKKDLESGTADPDLPSFLNKIKKEAFTGSSVGNLEDRLSRNKHFVRRGNLDEADTFRK